jgi:epoxyqueuosine reductase
MRSIPRSRPWVVRAKRHLIHLLSPIFSRVVPEPTDQGMGLDWMRFVPTLPLMLRSVKRAPVWPEPRRETPTALQTVPGAWRNAEAEDRAYAERPLHDYIKVHSEAVELGLTHAWYFILPVWPRMLRALRRCVRATAAQPDRALAAVTVEDLTEGIRAEAARLGLSAVGFAAYDPRYTYAEYAGKHDEGSVIVCLLEQDFEGTQTIPSPRGERAAFVAYSEAQKRTARLAEFVHTQGYRAQPHGIIGPAVSIPYAVQAGLGQLGLNGQLLTPEAGSRCRIFLITTNAQLVHGEPVDFGVNAICDACQICVRRCPVGAIPKQRAEHRGVLKAKIKTERCFPLVAIQLHGCAICMKVCPVQRYGIDAINEHFEQTGEILGKGSDDLEGYAWPMDGKFYGAGKLPARNISELINPPGLFIDPQRLAPLGNRQPDTLAPEPEQDKAVAG